VANNALDAYSVKEEKPESVENTDFQEDLASFIKKQFQRAEEHKRAIGIEARLLRNLSARKMEYSPEQLAIIDPNTNVYIGLCSLKARAAESWLTDIILNNIDKPWTIEHTPVPDLPASAKEQVVDLLIQELATMPTIEDIRERAKELKSVALDQANEKAEAAVSKHEIVLNDQVAESEFGREFAALIQDFSTYPSVFMRGPFIVSKKVASWNGDTYAATEQQIPDVRVISPFDAYPSPTSTNTQNGEFFCERARLLPNALYNAIKVKGFDEVNIRRALMEYCEGYSLELPVDTSRDRLEETDQDSTRKKTTLDTIIYNGLVRGKWLIEHKVLVEDPQKDYEAEVWVVGEYVIKAVLNPNKLDRRPIHSTSFVKRNSSIWGDCVIDLVYDTERICNAAARAMVKNMAFASGPIVEADNTRLEGQDPRDLYPYKVFIVGPDLGGTGQPAIRFNKVDSVLNDLMALFERYLKVADDLSGIPAYVLGNPQVAGAGRTMGGLSMLMGNAAKGIKSAQLNIDREIITPYIEGLYDYNMQTSKDTSIKADAKVIARGATGLMQRELAQSRIVEVLNMLIPIVPIWDRLPDGIKVLLREFLKTTGLPIDEIIADPMKGQNLLQKFRELSQNESMDRGTSSPVPLPPQSQPALPNPNPQPTPLATAGPA